MLVGKKEFNQYMDWLERRIVLNKEDETEFVQFIDWLEEGLCINKETLRETEEGVEEEDVMNINSDKEQRLSESFDEYTYMLEECIDESLKELEEYKREMKEKRKHVLFRLKQVRDKQKQLESLALKIQKGLGEVV